MNSDANIAAYLSIGQKVNGWQKLSGLVEFFLPVHRRIQDFLYGGGSGTNSSGCVLTVWRWIPNCSRQFF